MKIRTAGSLLTVLVNSLEKSQGYIWISPRSHAASLVPKDGKTKYSALFVHEKVDFN